MTPTPGTNGIIEVQFQPSATAVPADYFVNHLTVNTGAPSVTTAQWQALTDAISGVFFATSGSWLKYTGYGGRTIAYDRADAKPRPEKAFTIYTPTTWATDIGGPAQVALCLSFFCGRNLKRLRGRMYLPMGPPMSPPGVRPSGPLMSQALALGTHLQSVLNGMTPVWQQTVHSDVLDTDNIVSNWWVNDVWDTQRRRRPKETTRVHSP